MLSISERWTGMEIGRKRHPGEIALGFLLLCHPGPVLFHILAVPLFALLAAWPHVLWGVLALVVAAHTAMHLTIAVPYDYCDRVLDARGKPYTPSPRAPVHRVDALRA